MTQRILPLLALLLPLFSGCQTSSPQKETGFQLIDTHIHLYDPDRPEGVDWPPPSDQVLYRKVLPEHYDAVCEANGIDATVIVEASARPEDNQWLLDLVKNDPRRYAVVGNLPVGTDEFAGLLERFSKDSRYVGIRMRQRPGGDAFFTDAVWRDLNLLAAKGLTLDLLMKNFSLEDAGRIAREVPDLKILVNHLTGLTISGDAPDPAWADAVKRLAAHENVYCKVSGIFQRSGQSPAPKAVSFYAPTFEVVYGAFGENRIIYGSNWPVTDRGGSYAEQLEIIRDHFAAKGDQVVRKLFAGNAQKFYGLGE